MFRFLREDIVWSKELRESHTSNQKQWKKIYFDIKERRNQPIHVLKKKAYKIKNSRMGKSWYKPDGSMPCKSLNTEVILSIYYKHSYKYKCQF